MKRAFTLTELLVVASVIAVVLGLLGPALSGATAAARSLKCQSQLREIWVWSEDHRINNGVYPVFFPDSSPEFMRLVICPEYLHRNIRLHYDSLIYFRAVDYSNGWSLPSNHADRWEAAVRQASWFHETYQSGRYQDNTSYANPHCNTLGYDGSVKTEWRERVR